MRDAHSITRNQGFNSAALSQEVIWGEDASFRKSSTLEQSDDDYLKEVVINEKEFKIRLADTEAGRSTVSMLVNKMYSWRGYKIKDDFRPNPNRITLSTGNGKSTYATITLNLDSEFGLLADDAFEEELDCLRQEEHRLCEFTKLAVDPEISSKATLAALFHMAFIYAHLIHKCTMIIIEVNPRHQRFYQRMLGFQMHGSIKNNRRVNAPACLLSLPISYAKEQIERVGGKQQCAEAEKTLYPYFFSPAEELGLAGRMIRLG